MTVSNFIYKEGLKFEAACRDLKNYLPIKYFIRPIYKCVVRRSNPVIATGVAFLAGDLILHQLGRTMISCVSDCFFNSGGCELTWNPLKTIIWMSVGVPVMFVKFVRASNQQHYL
ncbi:MAG TPA: hypothetical protein VLH77_03265 [Gammaproteobacteria bacterium]|nr:hypothetical protein [Gammaproteobacteria bacterium]